MAYILLLLAFVINATASILIKLDAQTAPLTLNEGIGAALWAHRLLLGGLVAFAINVIFYWLALRILPLAIAYPVMVGGSFIIVAGWSTVMLGEGMTLPQIGGYVMIFAGILLVSLPKGAL